ncbi:tetratricopeptide repeat protein [Candidatus Pelagibacter sp.]|nr:tetratricopeptide repeat protein [Candidatus Pelagibacter sp.]
MNKIVIAFFIFLINTVLYAEDQNKELDRLFLELKKNIPSKSSNIEQQIWLLWSTHPSDEKLTSLLDEGSRLVQDQKLYKAISIFTDAIELDPTWAEAWNKRATVFYMVGEFQKSQNDIDKVLVLEQRHFGALAGQGLVNIQLKNYEKAIKSYEKAQEIYPAMRSPKIMIKQIEELIKQQTI